MRKLYKFNKPERYEKIVPDYESRDDIKVGVGIYNLIILLNGVVILSKINTFKNITFNSNKNNFKYLKFSYSYWMVTSKLEVVNHW